MIFAAKPATRAKRSADQENAEAADRILADPERHGGQGALAVVWAEKWRQAQHLAWLIAQEARGKA